MRKILTIGLVLITLIGMNFISVSAEEAVEVDHTPKDYRIIEGTIESGYYKTAFTAPEDGKEYMGVIEPDSFTLIEMETNKVIKYVSVTTVNYDIPFNAHLGIGIRSAYDGFPDDANNSNWITYSGKSLKIGDVSQMAISTIAGMLAGPLGLPVSLVTDAAIDIHNKNIGNVYATYQKLINNRCNILYRRRIVLTQNNASGARVGSPINDGHAWDGSPWDYTQPSACRELVSSYPAN